MKTTYRTVPRPWSLADNRGSHRVAVSVPEAAPYVRIGIQWRRRDKYPERCGLLARRLSDDLPVNVKALAITREEAEIVLEAPSAGEYGIYYMPNRRRDGSWWQPIMEYAGELFPGCEPEWEKKIPEEMPEGKVLAIESRTEFDSFYPMELPATAEETKDLLSAAGDVPFVIFPEDRKYPVRMLYELPLRWVERGLRDSFFSEARPDEYYVFQLAVVARKDLEKLALSFENAPDGITCFNRDGVDWLGKPFIRPLCCPKGKVQPLWIGLQLPAKEKTVSFTVTVSAEGFSKAIPVTLRVRGEPVGNHGDGDLWRLSRLRWLNSSVGLDDEVVSPFTPVTHEGDTVSCLGRSVRFGKDGLPAGITSFFDQSIRAGNHPLPILREPIRFAVSDERGELAFSGFEFRETLAASGTYGFETEGQAEGLTLKNETRVEYDGHVETFLTLTAQKDMALSDISLHLALTPRCSVYMMGMGREGGLSPDHWEYRWDEGRANNFVWIGGVNGGLHLKLKHTEDVWEIYNYRKEGLPESWANHGKGGCRIDFGEKGADLRACSGPRVLKAGERVTFRYALQITPIKELDSDAHWRDRYDHPGDRGIDLESAKAGGATVVNLHQGQAENPYINYPFCRDEVLRPIIRKAHDMGIRYKLYYTVRELTTHAQEFFAVRSFGDEILLDGHGFMAAEHFKESFFAQQETPPSTGGPWICEHLPEGCTPAWQTILPDGDYDCSVATVGLSRWHNYYLEGLSWLMRETGADGIYLDGVGYDRQIMKRVRKVLDRSKEGCLIDFHSGNNFHPNYGLCNVLGQYMELLPSVDSLWIGEGFDYETTPPDYWLVEISGIPFGLMGDMLHRGGNKWRGMIFGMTPRCNWPEGGSPLPVWQLWDDFGMTGCTIRGWWDEECPVHLSRDDCKATAYAGEDRMLISLASWAEEAVSVQVNVDLPAGWDAEAVRCYAPRIEGFQEKQALRLGDSLRIEPARGYILILKKGG